MRLIPASGDDYYGQLDSFPTARSDSSGAFDFTVTEASGYLVEVVNDALGYVRVDSNIVDVALGQNYSFADTKVVRGGTLSGTLAPPADLTSVLNTYVMAAPVSGSSNASGFSSVSVDLRPGMSTHWDLAVAAGTYNMQLSSSYNATTELWWNSAGNVATKGAAEAILVEVGETVSSIDGMLSYGDHTIRGTVRDDQEKPLANVSVQARPVSNSGSYSYGRTGADGTYIIGNLAAGGFAVQFDPQSGDGASEYYDNVATIEEARTLAFTSGVAQTHSNIDATIERGYSISGTVTVASNFTGYISVTAEPKNGGDSIYGSVNDNGSYILRDLPAGDYIVKFTAGSATQYFDDVDTKAEAKVLTLPSGAGDLVGINATIALATISGTVASAPNTSYSQVEFVSLDGTETIATAGVWNGEYSVEVKPGSYKARILENNGIRQYYNGVYTLADAETIVVTDGETRTVDFGVVGGSISGTVSAKTSVAGAVAMLYRADDTYNSIRTLTLDETGEFSFEGLAPNNYMIEVASGDTLFVERWFGPSGKSTDATAIDLKADAKYTTADVTLTEGGGIRGTITLPATLDYARISLYSEGYEFVTDTYAYSKEGSDQRTWSLAGVPAGEYTVELSSSGTSAWWKTGTSYETATPILVTAGGWVDFIDFAPSVSISGTVTSALDGSAVMNGTVYAYLDAESYRSNYADIESDGSYAFNDLPAGDYRLSFEGYSTDGAFSTQWYSGAADSESATPVPVVDGAATTNINVALQPGIAISGTVTDAATGAPIVNAWVYGWSGYGANTDANGHYSTTVSAPGSYQIQVDTDAYVPSNTSVDVLADGLTNANVQLVSGTVISGTVTAANNGVPLSNVNVYISTNQEDWWSINQTYTDHNGNFTSDPLLPGNYYVRYTNDQGQYVTQWFDNSATRDGSTAVEVGIVPITDIDAQLTLGGGIVGTITGTDGEPIANARVGLATAPPTGFARFAARLFATEATTGGQLLGIETTTGEDGTYELPPVEPGRYALFVYDSKHKTSWFNGQTTWDQADVITVVAGENKEVSVEAVAPLAADEVALIPEQTITNDFTITQQPRSQSVESGEWVSLTAVASGNPLPTIQWQKKEAGEWADINGATGLTVTAAAPDADTSVAYRAVFTQNGVEQITSEATLTGLAPITAPTAPALPTLSKATYTGGTVSWLAPAANGAAITGYTINVYEDGALVRTIPTGVVLTSAIGGLTNGTEYEVTLTANNSKGASVQSEPATLNTIAFTAPGAPAQPDLAAIDSAQVSATWSAPTDNGGTSVTEYTVNLYQGSNLVETKKTDARTLAFTGLNRATKYTVEVIATNSAGSSSASDRSAEATTKATVPDAAGAPTLETASVSELTVSWTAPNNGGAAVTDYTVRLFNGTELVDSQTVEATTVTFEKLVRGIAYTADVSATNTVGVGAASAISESLTIAITVPGIPEAPTLTAESATEVTATWSAPADDGGSSITGYRVNLYQGSDLVKTATTDALTLDFAGLTRATAYTAEVSAENAIGSDAASERSAEASTPATTPGSLAAVNLAATSATQLAATWSAPADDGGTPITGYTATLFQGTELVATEETADRNFTFTGLTRATAYTVEVLATNEVGDGPSSERSAEVTTPATLPDAAAAPTLVQASVSEITVSWAAPHNGGAAITGYTVRLFNGSTLAETKTTEATMVTFAGLTRGIAYTADVAAATTIGSGETSDRSKAVTIPLSVPGVPDAPTLAASSATEISVTWSSPVDDGGSAITGYQINLFQGSELAKTATTDALTVTFTGLTRATAYTAEVIAINAIGGDSVSDRSAVVSTPTTIPGVPAVPTATARSAAEVAVTWSAPADDGGSAITGYTVSVWLGGGLIAEQTTDAATTTATIAGLLAATEYTATVRAINAVGSASSEESAAARTLPATPIEDDLNEDIENAIVPAALELTQGQSVTISGLHAGEQYYAWFLSTPIGTSWQTSSSTGTITVTVPAALLGAHRIAIANTAGAIMGWSNVTIAEVAVPEVTVPEVAVPEVTVPEIAAPEVTVPEVAVPEVTIPAAETAAVAPSAQALSDTGTNPLPFTLLAGLVIALGAAGLVLGRRRGRAGLVR